MASHYDVSSDELIARWNHAYEKLFTASFSDLERRSNASEVAAAYRDMAQAWLELSMQTDIPLWARHAASIAASDMERQATPHSRNSTDDYQ